MKGILLTLCCQFVNIERDGFNLVNVETLSVPTHVFVSPLFAPCFPFKNRSSRAILSDYLLLIDTSDKLSKRMTECSERIIKIVLENYGEMKMPLSH